MRSVVIVFALAAVGAIAGTTKPAEARDYRYCLYEHWDNAGDCSFDTYAQCQASASGRVAYCNINPRVAFAQQPPQRRIHRHKPVRQW